jgi:hypothetical protein
MILEYKMDRDFRRRLVTPYWIECGGFMRNPSNFTMIGFSPDVHEYKIPDSAKSLSSQECKDRMLAIHADNPQQNEDGAIMTIEEIEAMVDLIISENDIP